MTFRHSGGMFLAWTWNIPSQILYWNEPFTHSRKEKVLDIHILIDLFPVSTSATLRSLEESQENPNKQKEPGSEKFR